MPIRIVFALTLAPLLLGCGSSEAIVSGTVTVNGEPLRQGHITFFPTEGTKAARGATVIDGQYQVKALVPGQRRAVIAATPEVQVVQHAGGLTTLMFSPSAARISPRAHGNQQVVEIQPGTQTLNFELRNP